MKYTIYKTTNLVNEKFYIGMHRTENPDDSYMGSGVALKRAITKYGKENFSKEVLFVFDTEKEMIQKEIEIVNEDLVNNPKSYNMTLGGKGSWFHVDVSGENNPNFGKALWKKDKTQEEIDEINAKRASHGEANGMYGKTHTEEAKKIMSEKQRRPYSEKMDKETAQKIKEATSKRFKNKPKSEEQKRKMSETAKERWKNIPIVECPHCEKKGKRPQMKQWHFNNCKLIKD